MLWPPMTFPLCFCHQANKKRQQRNVIFYFLHQWQYVGDPLFYQTVGQVANVHIKFLFFFKWLASRAKVTRLLVKLCDLDMRKGILFRF